MKTKIVYALVSGPDDYYALQAWVSVLSLRHHCPHAYVEIVCDRKTADYVLTLPLSSIVDGIVRVDFPESMSPIEISRRLKTGLRKLVRGDFLYIDTDTVITGPLDGIDELSGSLYAVADAHCGLDVNPYLSTILKNARVLGYVMEGETVFYNGGVTYAKDDEVAAAFYRKWNELYTDGVRKGIFIDQPSYAQANIELGHPMEEMSGIWNCQLRHGARFLGDSRVLHYLWTAKRTGSPFILGGSEIWKEIGKTRRIPQEVIDLFDNPFAGIQDMTYLASSEETVFINGRVCRVAYKFNRDSPFFNSLLKLCVKVLDATYKLIYRNYGKV